MGQISTSQNSQPSQPQKSVLDEIDLAKLSATVSSYLEEEIRDIKYTKYGYLFDRFPVYTDKTMPASVKREIAMSNSVGYASPDGVFISGEQIARLISDFYPKKTMHDWETDPYNKRELQTAVRNILQHEYGHVVHGHPFLKELKDKKSAEAQKNTCEIEANRGVLGKLSEWFETRAVTDRTGKFAPAQECITHDAIYKKVKELLDEEEQNGGGGSDDENDGNDGNDGNDCDSNNNGKPQPFNDIMKRSMATQCETSEDAMDKLANELGITPSSQLTGEGNTTDQILDEIAKQFNTRLIRKSLERIKGHLKGDLCRTKVPTYSRQSCKDRGDGLMTRGRKRGQDHAPKILIALDASGSMDEVSVKNATVAIKSILNTIGRNKASVDICTFNIHIHRFGKEKDWEKVVSSYYPSGGTNFACVMERAITLDADVVLCVGDGECYLTQDYLDSKYRHKDKYPRWVDVIIKESPQIIDYVKNNYILREGQDIDREVLWLGNDADLIKRLVGDYE